MREPALSPPRSPQREPSRAVFLAILLGLAAGFVHGWNLSLVGLLLLVVFFNVRARLFLAIWFVGVALSWMLVPLSYAIGRFVLDSTPLGSVLGLLHDTPLVPLFGWDRYTVVGGLLVALALSAPAYITMRGWIASLRSRRSARADLPAIAVDGPIEHLREAPRGSKHRFAYWLLVDDSGAAEKPLAAVPLVRPLGLWGLLVGVGLGCVAAWWFAPTRVSAILLRRLAEANRAQIDVQRLQFDLWAGRLEAENIALANPDELAEDRLRIARLTADFNPMALLHGRLEIGQLRLTGLEASVLRERLAVRYGNPLDGAALAPPIGEASLAEIEANPDGAELADYVQDWKRFAGRFSQLNRLCTLVEAIQNYDAHPSADAAPMARGLFQLLRARSELGWSRPTIFIRSATVEDLPPSWDLGTGAVLRLYEINSNAALCPRPTRVEVESPDRSVTLAASLDLRQRPYRRQLDLRLENVLLSEHLLPTSSKQRLSCDAGVLSLRSTGWMDTERIELHCLAEVEDLSLHLLGDRPVRGVEPALWNESIERLGALRVLARLSGRWSSPRLVIDTKALGQHIEQRLRIDGYPELASQIGQQLSRLESPAPAPARPAKARLMAPMLADSASPCLEENDDETQPAPATASRTVTAVETAPASLSSYRVERLPPIPVPVIIDAAQPPRSSSLELSRTQTEDIDVCRSQNEEADDPSREDTRRLAAVVEPQPTGVEPAAPWSPAPDPTDSALAPADLYDAPSGTAEKFSWSQWTESLLAQARQIWPFGRKVPLSEDPFLQTPQQRENLPEGREGSRLSKRRPPRTSASGSFWR